MRLQARKGEILLAQGMYLRRSLTIKDHCPSRITKSPQGLHIEIDLSYAGVESIWYNKEVDFHLVCTVPAD
jgi:hypothetical protein